MIYDIFAEMNTAISQFDNESINVVPNTSDDQGKRYLVPENVGYQFSQKKMLADIDMAYNSIYKNGKYDREGQRKLYLNIVRFYVQVAIKNTDIDTKNYVFTPEDYTKENIWTVWFFKRQFDMFVKNEGYDKTINDLNADFNKYGTCLSKKIKGDVIRVPLRAIRCDQGADTLLDGIEGGTPLLQEHEMSYVQMSKYKDTWDIPEQFKGKRVIQEMYSYMPKCECEKLNGKDSTDEEMVLTMAIIMPAGKMEDDKRKKYDNRVLFCEQISTDDFPYQECHADKQDGRWLGIGNVEKQLENQIARNLSANLRRRSMLWASKQIWQTQGDGITKNLVKNVQDGEVLQVGLNGLISKVDTSSRSLADFSQDEQIWDENSKQQSFAFEAATGESMPSGTAFRLGAMLSNSAMSYFDKQKEIFGIFLQKSFYSQIIPIFKSTAKNDIAVIAQSEQGFGMIKSLFVEQQSNQHYAQLALSPQIFEMENIPTFKEVQQFVDQKLSKEQFLFVDLPKEIYKNAKYKVSLDITGENRDVADKETLITLYTTLSQKGDPRAEKVLEVLLGSMGKNLQAIAGASMPQQPQVQNPDLAGLLPQTK